MHQDLQKFIEHARAKNMDHATIRMLLLSAGWKEKDIAEAMSAEGLDMPVPLPPDSGGAREAFFHLIAFGCLYINLVSLTILYFMYINRLFPDVAIEGFRSGNYDLAPIRWSMSAIIVSFPLFLWMSKLLLKELKKHPEKVASGIRRWLTYLTLFVAAGALVGDIITLVFYLLEGELSVRFTFKVLTVLVLAGFTFGYYFLTLRWSPTHPQWGAIQKRSLVLSSVIVVLALVWGALLVGSPGVERSRKIDEQRVNDLRAISQEIQNIVYEGKPYDTTTIPSQPIPSTLKEVLEKALYAHPQIVDPVSGEEYGFAVLGSTTYELCATFETVRDEVYDIFWNHPAAEHCFSVDVTSPNRY